MAAKKPTKSKAPEKKIFTDSTFPVKRIYQKSSKKRPIEDAGKYPFTRGIHPGMFRERFWTMRQYSGFGDAKLTNERFKFMLEKGQTGLSMAFDGYDSDSPQAEGEVGKVGVSITSIKDMMIAFDGIPLGKVSSSMTINSTASTLLAYYIAVGEAQGFKSHELRGTTQKPSMRLIGDMIEYCAEKVPSWYPVSISGYHMREAGCTATQEVAFTLANAIAYIQTCIDKGLKIDDFAPRLSFFFCCTIEFFEEVAKFRVARKVYAKILKEMFHAKNPN
jgi:methylmalonyl-CoA mutase N-terminal domain/subunit